MGQVPARCLEEHRLKWSLGMILAGPIGLFGRSPPARHSGVTSIHYSREAGRFK